MGSCLRADINQCSICSSELYEMPFLSQSLRSDGILAHEPLLKFQCARCGVLIGGNRAINIPYRRSNGEGAFDIARHKAVAHGVCGYIDEFVGGNNLGVLEVGAASFSTCEALRTIRPDYKIAGIDPYPEVDREAIGGGVEVIIDDFLSCSLPRQFNVVFSNQVIEHFPDPIEFLQKASSCIYDDGVIIVCCPSWRVASTELLFSDHLWHFTPDAMSRLGEKSDLNLIHSETSWWDSLTEVFLFKKDLSSLQKEHPNFCYSTLMSKRRAFFDAWIAQDQIAIQQLQAARTPHTVTIYGAGEYSQLLRAYLPLLWSNVSKIVVDDLIGARSFDKPVLNIQYVTPYECDPLVVGARKSVRQDVILKLLSLGFAPEQLHSLSV